MGEEIKALADKKSTQAQSTESAPKNGIHTKFSTLDGISSPSDYVESAKKKGYASLGVTDHYNVQSFPEFSKHQSSNLKIIYGCELEVLADKLPPYIFNHDSKILEEKIGELTYCVFDLETTGFFSSYNEIIEIGYVIYKKGEIILLPERKSYSLEKLSHVPGREKVVQAHRALEDSKLLAELLGNSFNSVERKRKAMKFYDYIEASSPNSFRHLWLNGRIRENELKAMILNIINMAKEINVPTIAYHNVHYCEKKRNILKEIIVANEGMNGYPQQIAKRIEEVRIQQPPLDYSNTESIKQEENDLIQAYTQRANKIFEGEKTPDIDLNFSGEYQKVAHNYVRELLGKDSVYRIGTINALSQQTAEIFWREHLRLRLKINPDFSENK
nr:5365_t:CDS:2 [Entrophospora candida]